MVASSGDDGVNDGGHWHATLEGDYFFFLLFFDCIIASIKSFALRNALASRKKVLTNLEGKKNANTEGANNSCQV